MRLEWRDMFPGDGPAIHTSLTGRETDQLRWLGAGGDVLEIGSAYGYSTVVLALAGARVTAVDPHIALGSLATLKANLAAYEVTDRVEIRQGYSQHVLPTLTGRFDLAWIDGDHEDPAVEHDVTMALKLLRPGGVLACHDYDEATCPGVRTALDRVLGPPEELFDTLAVYRGLV